MNGNEIADILRMPSEPGKLSIPWGSEYWKTERPTMKGYAPWFEERYGRLPKSAYRPAKDLSEELANMLTRPEVKMLNALERAELIERVQKAQAAIAEQEQAREKHETEMLEIGRQKKMQEKIQVILQSDRAPAQKVTALTLAGVPISDARDMVWGERAPEEEARRPTREAAPTARARPEELVAALRPEEERGVQFRMVGGELIKEPARAWGREERRLTPEQKIAKRTADLEEEKFFRARQEKIGEELEETKKGKEEEYKKSRVIGAISSTKAGKMSTAVLAGILETEGYSTDIVADYIGKPLTELEKEDLKGKKLDNAVKYADHWRKLDLERIFPIPLEERKFEEESKLETDKFEEEMRVARTEEERNRLTDEHDQRMDTLEEEREARKADREERDKKIGHWWEVTKWEEETRQWEEEAKEDKRQWVKDFGAERAQEMFDNLMRERERSDEVFQVNRQYRLDVEKYGDEKATEMREFRLKKWEAVNIHKKDLWDMGFKDKEFIEKKAQWWADFWETEKDRKEKAKQFDITEDRLVKEEANRVREFEEKLKKQYKDLDLEVKKYGLTKDTEARIAKMALWQYTLDWQKLGHDGALLKWEKEKAKKEYWWKEKEVGLKNLKAATSFMSAMDKIIGNAKTSDNLWQLVNKVLGDSLGEDYANLVKVLNEEGKAQMEIPEELSVALDTLAVGKKDNAMEMLEAAYNTKTGDWHIPNQTRMRDIGMFFLGDPEIQPKDLDLNKLGCNLSFEEFVDKILQEPFWSDADKGAVIRMRVDPQIAQGLLSKATEKGVLKIEGEEIREGRTWDPRTWFWGLFKGKKEAPVGIDFPTIKEEVDALYDRTGSMAQVERYLGDKGLTLDEYKEWLRGK